VEALRLRLVISNVYGGLPHGGRTLCDRGIGDADIISLIRIKARCCIARVSDVNHFAHIAGRDLPHSLDACSCLLAVCLLSSSARLCRGDRGGELAPNVSVSEADRERRNRDISRNRLHGARAIECQPVAPARFVHFVLPLRNGCRARHAHSGRRKEPHPRWARRDVDGPQVRLPLCCCLRAAFSASSRSVTTPRPTSARCQENQVPRYRGIRSVAACAEITSVKELQVQVRSRLRNGRSL
jgi:hypothetical protein